MESYFKTAPEKLISALSKRVEPTEEDGRKIELPKWRYAEIEDAILALFREVDARFVPLDPLAIAQAIGCGPIPYRTFGQIAHRVFKKASPDALTIWLGESPLILFDDRKPANRCQFSMMHEIAHVRLGHRDHSKLAEIEANYFAASALCPLVLLARSGLVDAADVARHFGVSEACAQHRLDSLAKWKSLPADCRNVKFGREVAARFTLKIPVQTLLFEERASC